MIPHYPGAGTIRANSEGERRVYLSLSDRPKGSSPDGRRVRVSSVVWTLGFVSLLTDISSESVAAILPVYLTSVVGLSMIAYGFVDGLYQGVSAVVRIGGGWAADRYDRPKPVAVVGYGLSAVAKVGLLFASGMASVSAVVSADRIGKGIRTAPRDAMISAATPTAHLGRAFGVHRSLDTVGAAIGPLLAFLILWAIPGGYRTVTVVSLAFALTGVALLVLLVPRQSLRARGNGQRTPFRWRDLADRRLVRLLVVVSVLGLLTVGDGFLYLALLDRSDFAATWFPLLYVGTNVAYLSLAVPLGRLADRVGRARMLALGHLALLAAYGCAAVPAGAAWPTLVTLLLLGVFYAATDGVTAAVAGRMVAASARASGIAAAQTCVALARLVCSSVFGVLWYAVGARSALAIMGVGLIVAIPAAFVALRGLDPQEETA